MDVGYGYFLVKFDLIEDREKVIFGGPWMLQDHYLVVKEWSPSFNSCEPCFGRTMVWIRFSGLNVMFFEEKSMKTIAAAVGKPICVDFVTKSGERGHFARVCVEVDLSVPVIDEVWVHDHWHKVEFESLHLICSDCKRYGHVARNCDRGGEKMDGAPMVEQPVQQAVQEKSETHTCCCGKSAN